MLTSRIAFRILQYDWQDGPLNRGKNELFQCIGLHFLLKLLLALKRV
jgi:hypothetical protein